MTCSRYGVLVSLAIAVGCGGGGGATAGYFPMNLGATWSYAVTPTAGTAATETMQNTAGSSSTLTKTHTPSNGPTYTNSFLVDSSGVFVTGTTYPASQTTFSPPCLLLPSNTTPGFSTSTTSIETLQGSTNATYTATCAVTIDGVETVTVPAGTFSALKFTRLLTINGVSTYNVRWHAPGVGAVKIVNYPQATPTATTTWALTSYSIP
jgi:hypothetical protein